MFDAGGDGWGGVSYVVTTNSSVRYAGSLADGSVGVDYFCLEDGMHEFIIVDTDPDITWEFDDASGASFNGKAPVYDIFHTTDGDIYGTPSHTPTVTPIPSVVPSPSPTDLPAPSPTAAPVPAPSVLPTGLPIPAPTVTPGSPTMAPIPPPTVSMKPTPEPTAEPTGEPTGEPTAKPTTVVACDDDGGGEEIKGASAGAVAGVAIGALVAGLGAGAGLGIRRERKRDRGSMYKAQEMGASAAAAASGDVELAGTGGTRSSLHKEASLSSMNAPESTI